MFHPLNTLLPFLNSLTEVPLKNTSLSIFILLTLDIVLMYQDMLEAKWIHAQWEAIRWWGPVRPS